MIEKPNWMERELRGRRVQEFAGTFPQLEGQPELPNACLQEATRFPQRIRHLSRCKIPTQLQGKNLSGRNFDPHWQKRKNTLSPYLSMCCIIRQALARDVIKGMRLATKKAIMKNQVPEINEPEFEAQVLHATQPVLVGFLTGWSKPCRLLEPVLDEVAGACNGKAKILKVNVDDHPDLGTLYAIQSVPTLIYFVNGAVRAKIVGMVSPKAIFAKLNSQTPENMPTKAPERPQ
jgi:thioredoxin 1